MKDEFQPDSQQGRVTLSDVRRAMGALKGVCLLYTSDAADEN